MAFYQPRANRTTQFPNVSQARATQQSGPAMGMVSTTQTPGQSGNGISDMASLYSAGKNGANLYSAGMGLLSPAIDFGAANAGGAAVADAASNMAFMAPEVFPAGQLAGTGTTSFLAGAPAAESAMLSTTAEASPWLSAAALAPESSAAIAGSELAGAAGAAEAGSALAGGAAEAGMLGALGPIGLAAGIGLLGTKLFGLW